MSCLCCTGSDSSLPQAALFPPLPSFLSLLRSLYPSPSLAVTFSSSSLLGSPSSGCHARPRRTFQYEAACCSGFLAGTSLSQGGSATPGCVFSVRVCVCVCARPRPCVPPVTAHCATAATPTLAPPTSVCSTPIHGSCQGRGMLGGGHSTGGGSTRGDSWGE